MKCHRFANARTIIRQNISPEEYLQFKKSVYVFAKHAKIQTLVMFAYNKAEIFKECEKFQIFVVSNFLKCYFSTNLCVTFKNVTLQKQLRHFWPNLGKL